MSQTGTRGCLLILALLGGMAASGQELRGPAIAEIERQFAAPPNDSKPMVRWWWFGAAVEKAEILRELRQMKADGIGGAELAFVYPLALDDAALGVKNLPFVSPEMLAAVTYAATEGRKLGLRIDVTLCSGWPYGGPATTLAQAAGQLHTVEIPVIAGATSFSIPKMTEGDRLLAVSLAAGMPKRWDSVSARRLMPPYTITAAAEPRVAVLFIASHTRQQVKRSAVRAEGYVLDPFSREAVATHLKAVGEPLVEAFGKTPPYAIFSDSLEAYGADWTPALPAEFQKRRGYDLIAHLPELVAGGSPAAEQVRHDYGRTLTELVDENYLTQIDDWAHAHHTKFRSQTYGEPAVTLSSQRLVDLPEGEGPQWRAFSTLRWATSANHLFGNNVSSGETFTWLHSPVFRATPLDMKVEADLDFLMGENQLIYHGWPYSAHQAGEPGWSLYAAAVFNEHNPWHPVMPAVDSYIARVSYLLRQGKAANQVALLLPTDDAWAGFSPGKVTVSGAMEKLVPSVLVSAILTGGYNLDFIDAAAIERLGVPYEVLVLPPTDRLPLETLRKIEAYARNGGHVIAVGRAPLLDADGERPAEWVRLAAMIFAANAVAPDFGSLTTALSRSAAPDFKIDAVGDERVRGEVGFIRRCLPDADIYFVANTANHPVSFRASFASVYPRGARSDPETGLAGQAAVSAKEAQIDLAAYESAVYVFRDGVAASQPARLQSARVIDLSKDWVVTFPALRRTLREGVSKDWTADPQTLHYSGEAVYARDFELDSASAQPAFLEVSGGSPLPLPGSGASEEPHVANSARGIQAFYGPPVREAALVTINGKDAGALWHPPYRLEVSKLLHPGANHIEIRVYNTALNAWSALPPHDYRLLTARFGERFQMQDLDQVRPVSSGLLGSVHLLLQHDPKGVSPNEGKHRHGLPEYD